MSDMHGNKMHPSFPKYKKPMDVNDHPDDHNITTEHEHGSPSGPTVEMPQTTKTGKAKGVKFPFHGANS